MSHEILHYSIVDRDVRRRLLHAVQPADSDPVESSDSADAGTDPSVVLPLEPDSAENEEVLPPAPALDTEALAELRQALERGWSELGGELRASLDRLREECLELAFAAAQSITRREIERGTYELESVLREVVEEHRTMLGKEDCELHLNPEDALHLNASEVFEELDFDVVRTSDPNLARGTLVLRCGHTSIVRDVEGELQALRAHLLDPGGARP